ncbi:MAG: U32 family peptidase [Hespellia sp.]|nr:U32 family peptidase [Hespellia sp.]
MQNKKIEVLAPAGSYESLKAAVAAGADAVYVGGCQFGARAFAENFSQEELLEAIDYVHLHGCRLFLTVNTLLKNEEIQTELYQYLAPFYAQGLDAVIVQDVGVVEFIKRYFPEIDIHISTQMTITNVAGAKLFQKKGVQRIVTSRELQLDEIKEIVDETGLEVESFVHGALCYCYSGQCLFSSLIGGRSGNRGQCAQPCRLPYEVKETKVHGNILSLKDICTLDDIPDLIEHGIYSLKIEGRMKKPEYVAAVTSMYRKYTDLYFEAGRENFHVDENDKRMLMDIYNRGGFDSGYYHKHNGAEMITKKRSNHAGVPAVRVLGQKGRELTVQALTQMNKGDILELDSQKGNYTLGQDLNKGDNLTIIAPKGHKYNKGTILHRIRNQKLLDEVQQQYVTRHHQSPIAGKLRLCVGEPAVLALSKDGVSCEIHGEIVDMAKNQPMMEERVRRQMQKTGNMEFYFESLSILMEGRVFLPMQQLNELRRTAMLMLSDKICESYRREMQEIESLNTCIQSGIIKKTISEVPQIHCCVETKEQLQVVSRKKDVVRIYVDTSVSSDILKDEWIQSELRAIQKEKEIYLAMPRIFRKPAILNYENNYEKFLALPIDGVLLRNYESYEFLAVHHYKKNMVLDHNLYVFNAFAREFWEKEGIREFTAPVELNYHELKQLALAEHGTQIVYGYLPMMVSAQCVKNTTRFCDHTAGLLTIKDRYQKEFYIKNDCNYCYNVIYNCAPLFLADRKSEVESLRNRAVRLDFTLENEVDTEKVLDCYLASFSEGADAGSIGVEFTRGHFNRGIK